MGERKRLSIEPTPEHVKDMDQRPALRGCVDFIEQRFGARGCDSHGVASCERCNVVALARYVRDALDRERDGANRA